MSAIRAVGSQAPTMSHMSWPDCRDLYNCVGDVVSVRRLSMFGS